jgi:hypothetical protein
MRTGNGDPIRQDAATNKIFAGKTKRRVKRRHRCARGMKKSANWSKAGDL